MENGPCFSEDPLRFRVNLFESTTSALLKNVLCLKASIFIKVVCCHAMSEGLHVFRAELFKDALSWGSLIFSGETRNNNKATDRLTK